MDFKFYTDIYFETIKSLNTINIDQLSNFINSQKSKNIYLFGNGACSSFASHYCLDLNKQCGISANTLSDPSMITALSNDYKYEDLYVEYLKLQKNFPSLIILMSVSGESKNLINLLNFSNQKNYPTLCITGKSKNNYLNKNSKYNIHINSNGYNIVENTISLIMGYFVDCIKGDIYYDV